jgi:hypothetical protein
LRRLLAFIIDPFAILGAILLGLLAFAIVVGFFWLTRPAPATSEFSDAELTVIPLPTETLMPPTLSPTVVLTPTVTSLPLPPAGNFNIGDYVQISGTGGDGLRLREEPGLESQVRLLGSEAEVFQVKDGPRQADNYTWWYLVAPYDETRRGWAVANYLAPVQNP